MHVKHILVLGPETPPSLSLFFPLLSFSLSLRFPLSTSPTSIGQDPADVGEEVGGGKLWVGVGEGDLLDFLFFFSFSFL